MQKFQVFVNYVLQKDCWLLHKCNVLFSKAINRVNYLTSLCLKDMATWLSLRGNWWFTTSNISFIKLYQVRFQPLKKGFNFGIDQIFIVLCPTLREKSPNLRTWPSYFFPKVYSKQHAEFQNGFCYQYLEKCIYTYT